ncbi:Plasmodium exported protein, unknown function [Plasmodium knowlesi strain H]|uniref:Pv-fam-d protein n=3 Tax=Plasmodium knowlesi TaxID=5850 RepID=A0A5K1VCR4_PLAKH|nr:Plasmodium exported protein, unknown function [Plasmodium knowlesi strain H]OTN64088.1 Uncharacterized protein PKNOH_S140219300 [Plasmodium knowlesi]CAA9990621.1 Plasmodium exported protein, unknown function [Plasmodium knowlesi strain H]SBO26041.1 Plasmodium exported protein, unknown function [Plasmodium knowlesi strain H]SBO28737.1 Plasmodium exported protein, unknown function [Plasmodium knowlesi strain H]VVS80095.1 Plasmodium exported protein, unknown function [Plasmodium knowlesi strai|eukprot:XP_002261913.1 hypothetical protein, conserved in Plasmodium species [Plasmodium knowlesi strain H]
MYRILFTKIFFLTLSAWILRASDNRKGVGFNVNNRRRSAHNDLQLRVPRLLSVNDLDSEIDYGSLESLGDGREKEEIYERRGKVDLRSFTFDDSEELDPNLESFKEYMKYVAKSDKSFREKYDDTRDYIKNMDPMTRKKIKNEMKDRLSERRRTKRRRKCSQLHGLCNDMYGDLQYNDYRMKAQIRKMKRKISARSFIAGALSAILAILLFPIELICSSGVLLIMGLSLVFLLLEEI